MPALARTRDARGMTGDVAGLAGNGPTRYRIVVRGEFRASRTGPLEGMSVRLKDGCSVITGEITDQSQLHGILEFLGERAIEIVSLSSVDRPDGAGGMGG